MRKITRKIIVLIVKKLNIYQISINIRTIYYKIMFKNLGNNSQILGKITVYNTGNVSLGNNSFINKGVVLSAAANINIGNYCNISGYTKIYSLGLNLSEKNYKIRKHIYKNININDGVWIGAGSIILMGVTIGEGAVIAAGSVIIKDIPPFELWGGVPAKKIKNLINTRK